MPESSSGQGQMSFVSEQMRPCFVPFLSWPPGWGCSGTLTPKLVCLTSAVAAQGTSLLGCRAAAWAIRALLLHKCQDSPAAVAAAALHVHSTGYTCVHLYLCVCLSVHLPSCLSWLQEVTCPWLKAVTPALRMQSSRMWGSTGAATAESASPSCSPAYLSYSKLLSVLGAPQYTMLAQEVRKAEWPQLSQSRTKYQNLHS